ncbi:MAG: HNH endonuclease [Blastocatellia bacterium]
MMKRKVIPRAVRRLVRERAKYRCEYCLHPDAYSSASFVCEHIIPRSKGAGDTPDELAWACPYCNGHKHVKTHARDPQTNQMTPLFNPRRQKWARHFAWSDDSLHIIGLTATGRATAEALKLNRKDRTGMRSVLIAADKHPPQNS